MSEPDFAAGFPAADEAHWLELVEKVLAGRDFARTLTSRTGDGLTIEPVYSQASPGHRIARDATRWRVIQRVDHPDIETANRLARADIDGGADGLELVFPGSIRACGFGVAVESLADLSQVLDGIDLTTTPLRIDAGYEIRNALICVDALIEERGIDPGSVDIIGLSDPVNGLMTEGRLVASYDVISDHGADMVHAILERGLGIRPFCVDVRGVHGGGGASTQELAYALANALEIARALEPRGIPIDRSIPSLTFAFAVDADQFVSMAKLRAFRLLWARVLDACGLPQSKPHVHAQTAWRMMARRDPWVNILRATVATAAAGLGGADSMTVLPFTMPLGLADLFARRIARNIQLVLIEESGLGRVADPAAGSGYIEALSLQMCETAWELFQGIERDGGLLASVRDGTFQQLVIKTRNELIADVATRKSPIVGVSEYPALSERSAHVLKPVVESLREAGRSLEPPRAERGERFSALVAEVRTGATFADLATALDGDWERAPELHSIRLAEPFERLRDRSDEALKRIGRRPAVFLATLGHMAEFTPRAAFARNAFEAGGIEAIGGHAYSGRDDMIDAFRESRAKLACICGTDDAYGDAAASLAGALKSAGAKAVWLAGRPGEREAGLREAGVDAFIYAGCDILGELTAAHERLGYTD